MKHITRALALALALIMVFALVSCAKTLSGTYTNDDFNIGIASVKLSYTFKGSKVVATVTTSAIVLGSSTTEYEGTYEITEATDGTQTISITFEDEDASKYVVQNKSFSENKDDGTITINGITYTKQK